MLKAPEAALIIHRWRGDIKVREGREAAAELHNGRIRMTVRQLISIGASLVEEDRPHGVRNYIVHVALEGDAFCIVWLGRRIWSFHCLIKIHHSAREMRKL